MALTKQIAGLLSSIIGGEAVDAARLAPQMQPQQAPQMPAAQPQGIAGWGSANEVFQGQGPLPDASYMPQPGAAPQMPSQALAPVSDLSQQAQPIAAPAASGEGSDWDRQAWADMLNASALGFNTMRLTPDQQLAVDLRERLDTSRKDRISKAQANKTAEWFRSQPGMEHYADLIEQNPALAQDLLKQVIDGQQHMTKTVGNVQIDPSTGQQYVIEYNPNNGKVERRDIEGATAITPQGQLEMEAVAERKESDINAAVEHGRTAFMRANNVDQSLGNLRRARQLITEQGASTGLIREMLPAFDASTAELRQIANSMGIDIINSATFGALSESELKLALSTGFPRGLSEAETVAHIDSKIAAQEKLRNQLLQDARKLSGGQVRYSEYIKQVTEANDLAMKRRQESPAAPAAPGAAPSRVSDMSDDELLRQLGGR